MFPLYIIMLPPSRGLFDMVEVGGSNPPSSSNFLKENSYLRVKPGGCFFMCGLCQYYSFCVDNNSCAAIAVHASEAEAGRYYVV